jgi:glutathione S-transferase
MKLYGYRNGRTLRALWALEEVGAPYEYVEVDVIRGEGQTEWFLAINPGGKVPVLIDGDLILPESAAICLHLADKYAEAELLPPLQTKARSECYKWISFILTELDAPLWTMAKHRFVLPADRRVAGASDTAIWEFGRNADLLASALGERRYLCDSFSVADILAGHTLLWATSARLSIPITLATYLDTLTAREALTRAKQIAKAAAKAR